MPGSPAAPGPVLAGAVVPTMCSTPPALPTRSPQRSISSPMSERDRSSGTSRRAYGARVELTRVRCAAGWWLTRGGAAGSSPATPVRVASASSGNAVRAARWRYGTARFRAEPCSCPRWRLGRRSWPPPRRSPGRSGPSRASLGRVDPQVAVLGMLTGWTWGRSSGSGVSWLRLLLRCLRGCRLAHHGAPAQQ